MIKKHFFKERFIYLQGNPELPGSAENISEKPQESLEKIRDNGLEQAKQLTNHHKQTTLTMSLRSVNPEKFQEESLKKFTHENETLINQIKSSDKEILKKLSQIRLTLESALNNINFDITTILEKIAKTDPRVLPIEGKKNFEEEIKLLINEEDITKFTAKAVTLCEEIKNYYDQILNKARSIDISI